MPRVNLSRIGDGGEVSGSLWFDPSDSSHDALFDLWDSPALASWRITDSQDTDFDFAGVLTNLSPSYSDLDENVTADFTIKVSGDMTITPTA